MSSTSLVLATLAAAAATSAAEVSCPATVTVRESAIAPEGWTSKEAARKATFRRASVLNGKPEGPEYDLAPSTTDKGKGGAIRQVWNLTEYRDMNLFLRCHYRGTDSVIHMDLAPELKSCVFQFRLDAKGNFLGQSRITCR